MSWLKDYLEFTERQESPEAFHMWSAITLIAATLGRKVWLDRRSDGITRYKVYPGQLMVVLVGGSGRVRKSTALLPIKRFAKAVDINIIQGKSSAEAFLDQLDPKKQGNPQSMILEGELGVLLSKQQYAEPLIDCLTKLADAEDDFVFTTRGSGKIVIPEPCVTMLAATTPTHLGESMPAKAQGTGYMSRVVFVYQKTTERIEGLFDVDDSGTTPDAISHSQKLETDLTNRLLEIQKLNGPFSFSREGRLWVESFYSKWVKSPEGQGEGWPTRRVDHMLRIAMVLAAAKSDKLEIDSRSLRAADVLLEKIELDFPNAFAYIGTTAARDRERIIDALNRNSGALSSTKLYNLIYHYFPDINSIKNTLALLRESGMIDLNIHRDSNGTTVEVWSLTSRKTSGSH